MDNVFISEIDHTQASALSLSNGNGDNVMSNGGQWCAQRDSPAARSFTTSLQPSSHSTGSSGPGPRENAPLRQVTPCCTRIRVNATGRYNALNGLYTMSDYINKRPSYQRKSHTATPLPAWEGRGFDLIQFTQRCGTVTGSTLEIPPGGTGYPRFTSGTGLGVTVGQKLPGLRPFDDVLSFSDNLNVTIHAAFADLRGVFNDTVTSTGLEEYGTINGLPEHWEQEPFFCDRLQFAQAGVLGFDGGGSVERTVLGPQFESCDEEVRCAEEIEQRCQRAPEAARYGSVHFECAPV
jgi:hypothetical protein